MSNRIKDKIKEIEKLLEEIEGIIPEKFEIYASDFKTKAACERYAEKIAESAVDLAFLIIKDKGLKIPEEEASSFDILAKEGVITADLAENLKKAKGMRNILAHEYGEIDDEIVFNAITEELVGDITEFIKNVERLR